MIVAVGGEWQGLKPKDFSAPPDDLGRATVTDEIIDLHDRIMGRLFNAAKNKHHQQFQEAGKTINDKVQLYALIGQALLDAREHGTDAFAAIETVMSWAAFEASVAEAQRLAQPDDFDFLHRISDGYATLRRYAPEFLSVLQLRAAPAAQDVLDAINMLRTLNADNARKVRRNAGPALEAAIEDGVDLSHAVFDDMDLRETNCDRRLEC